MEEKIKGIIFDYDGVIGDTFHVVLKTHNKLVERLGQGKKMTEQEFRNANFTDWKRFYKEQGITEENMENLTPLFLEEFMKMINDTALFDGIGDVIKHLSSDFQLSIVSNGDRVRIKHQLEKNQLFQYFKTIVGLETKKLKPDPYQLNLCMDALGIQPEETCFVGDTVDDILAGKNARVAKIIAATYGYQPAEMLRGADAFAGKPEDILKIINEWDE